MKVRVRAKAVARATARVVVVGLAAAAMAGCGSPLAKVEDGGGGATGADAGVTATGGSSGDDAGTPDVGLAVEVGAPEAGAPEAGAQMDAPSGADALLPPCDGPCTITFASGSTWTAYDDDPAVTPNARNLGAAQAVCLNAAAPPNCPAGAFRYGVAGNAWATNLSAIPGAVWIWGSGIAATDPADLQRLYFSRTFVLGTAPTGQISVGADDMATVRINGVAIGAVGSITDVTQAGLSGSRLTTFDISTALRSGLNTITIAAQNGPASFAGCASACPYSSNPAGAVFGGSLTYR